MRDSKTPWQKNTTCSVYKDLAEWASQHGIYLSTVLNGALLLLRETGVYARTKQYAAMRDLLILAALKRLGIDDIDPNVIKLIVDGRLRARLVVEGEGR